MNVTKFSRGPILRYAQHKFIAPNRHQSNEKLINIRRGEGGEVRKGGPLWSPVVVRGRRWLVDDRNVSRLS